MHDMLLQKKLIKEKDKFKYDLKLCTISINLIKHVTFYEDLIFFIKFIVGLQWYLYQWYLYQWYLYQWYL